MRLDHRTGARAWVIHVPSASKLKHCRWVDDETAQYAVIDVQATRFSGRAVERVVQAKRILIRPFSDSSTWHLVLIDPVEGVDSMTDALERSAT